MRMRLGLSVFAAAVAAGAVLAASALAQSTTRVSWTETWKVRGVPVLRFDVTQLTVDKRTWSAHVSFHNLLKTAVSLPRNNFGIAFYPSATLTPTTHPEAYGVADSFSHARPVTLKPGASWSGVISGPGEPKVTGKTWARIVFGAFGGIPHSPKLSLWITDHSLVLKLGATTSGPSGLVI